MKFLSFSKNRYTNKWLKYQRAINSHIQAIEKSFIETIVWSSNFDELFANENFSLKKSFMSEKDFSGFNWQEVITENLARESFQKLSKSFKEFYFGKFDENSQS